MKRLLTSAAMFLCCMSTTFAQFSGSGSGTENDPYLILNPIQLNQMRNFLNQSGVYFKLMANIDLTEYLEDENPTQGWQPVGNSSSVVFMGILDGNGKTISGLWINRPNDDNVGLFGYTSGCSIKNLILIADIEGKNNVGGFIGYAGCKSTSSYVNSIENCTFRGSIRGVENVGGFVGLVKDKASDWNSLGTTVRYASVQANNLQAQVSIISSGNNIGGIIGAVSDGNSNVSNCILTNSRLEGIDYVGGVIGRGSCGLSKCSFYGTILGNTYVGGICGRQDAEISGCVAVSSISALGDCIGGISGITGYPSISDSYFSGFVKGRNQVGGLVGLSEGGNYRKISHCQSMAVVKGNNKIGGLVGCGGGAAGTHIESSVSNCSMLLATANEVGRIVGDPSHCSFGAIGSNQENKAYNKTLVIGNGIAQDVTDNLQNGTGVSSTTLKLKATYVAMGWDFTDTWDIQEMECYPYMKTQTAPPVITSQVVSGATTISGKCVDGSTVTLEIDGEKQEKVSSGNNFSFTVSPLQAGHEVRISAKAEGKEPSYYITEVVSFLGKGTEADPYQVYTAADLTCVYRRGYYKLMNDIDLSDYINQFSPTEGWQSIGRDGSETIYFDGNGHKITGLWCNTARDNTGLFSCFANGTIKNLTVKTAKNKQVKGGANTGIIIGKMMNGTIENCSVEGTLANGTPVGGIVGLFDGGTISKCRANVTITTTLATSYVGGLVGETTGGTIDQCFTQGIITATGTGSYVGGLVGKNLATLTNCYSNATITSSYNAAGIVAYNYSLVDKCYATGNLFSSNYAAGIVGYNDGANAVVSNCVAMNNKIEILYESQQQQQGGGYGQRIIGGIKNGAPAPEMNNYALKTMQVSVNNVAQKVYDDIMNGVGKNISDLLKADTYQELGWDFTNIWTISEDESYPLLKENTGTSVKPGENPNPEPEPIVSDDDKLVVAEVMASKGHQVIIDIDLENKTTDLTAYQFDLTLPDGISLSVNDKGKFLVTKTSRYEDDSQTLNISKQEGNTYRFVCFSMSNEVITGTSGAILNASLTTGESVNVGSYEATITNIVCTKTDGSQLKLNDSKFNIVVNDASGTCGDNLTWVYTKATKTLVIEGTGAMTNYSSSNKAPWSSYEIERIVMPSGVTRIGNNAFYGCTGLTSITIPYSVTSIGNNAFSNCTGLTSITIPYSVTSIGFYAFFSCTGLTSITIPNSVTNLGSSVFSACAGLTNIKVESGNTVYDSRNNCNAIIKTATNELLSGCKTTIIPNSVTSIGNNAFFLCTDLTSVTIPNSVTSIGEYAFFNCTGLTSVEIPNSVTSIGNNAFSNCTGLTSVEIPNSVKSIGNNTFNGCKGLTSIKIPNSVTSIGGGAFHSCTGLKDFYCYAEEVPSTSSDAFNYTPISEATLYVPAFSLDTYKSIEPWKNFGRIFPCGECGENLTWTYNGVTKTLTIEGTGAMTDYFYVNNPWSSCEIENVVMSSGVTRIGDSAFSGCSGLTSITIPNSVTSIGGSAFSGCSGLTSITIPNGVKNIGYGAFFGCIALISIEIPNSVTSIESNTFWDCKSLTSITIGNSVTSIGENAFNNCKALTSITIPNSVTSIGNSAFANCTGLSSIAIPNSVTSIGRSAFYYCTSLTSVEIPNSVTSIDNFAFYCCNALTTVIVNWIEPISLLGDDTFSNSANATLYVPKGCKAAYKAANFWKEFGKIVEISLPTHKLIYMVDGEEYKSYDVEEGETIIPEAEPTKEGYTFSGWSEIPKTMPDHDVTVSGTFAINTYKLIYKVDGEVYKTFDVKYGDPITPEAAPTKEGYTFSGWSEIPETMPAHDVTVTGIFTLNTGIDQIMGSENGKAMIFTIDGKRVDNLKKGLNVIRMKDGMMRKVVVK